MGGGAADAGPRSGGRLVATHQAEPTNFNRLVAADAQARMAMLLTQGTLVRLNQATGDLEPRLAVSWAASDDRLTWTIALRQGVSFSDGTPFTAADVLFTFRALFDETVGSPMAADFTIGGKRVEVRALDDHQIVLTFPELWGPGLAILDGFPILPRHKLEPALAAGTLRTAWQASVNPSEVVGLGPFILREYVPAQRLVFVRNPNFWRKDDAGRALPYLDEIEIGIVPDQAAELLRLQSGQSDLITDFAKTEDLAALRADEAAGTLQLMDAGTSIDATPFFFNLTPDAKATASRPWLTAPEFRRAVSHAINRQAIVDTVFLGNATPIWGPVTPGFGPWYVPDLPRTEFDAGRARTLLTSLGLVDNNGDGTLEDKTGQPVRFSVLTRSGQPERERTMVLVQEQLRQVGIAVDIVALTSQEIQGRYAAKDFDAVYFGARVSSTDPIAWQGFWLSSGPFHWWNPGQVTPATEWEARIDSLMAQQSKTMDTAERRRLFTEVQQILADEVPALWLVAPNTTIPMSAKVRGATPVIFAPPVLWNAEQIYLTSTTR
jgi:peptide/nickel transport system substrate-binding protein